MMPGTCSREKELASLLKLGHWPMAASAEMQSHLQTCRACANMLSITEAMRGVKHEAMRHVQLPPPGLLWWRAQLRRRDEAVKRIAKPILGAQIFALGINAIVVLGVLLSQAKHGLHWLTWFSADEHNLSPDSLFHLGALWPTLSLGTAWGLATLIPTVALLAFLAGLVVYLASEKT